MELQEVVDRIVCQFDRQPGVEGVYLSGSLVNQHRDALSDVDLGIVSGSGIQDWECVYSLHRPALAAVGEPAHTLERRWDHCRLVAALYGRAQFPPVGLEVDLLFSPLDYVGEQEPGAGAVILWDRAGELRRALAQVDAARHPRIATTPEIQQRIRGFPFLVHDALKAFRRNDLFHFLSLAEEMRQAIFWAAGARYGMPVNGTKRAFQYLTGAEHERLVQSAYEFSPAAVGALAEVFAGCLESLGPELLAADEVAHLRVSVEAVL